MDTSVLEALENMRNAQLKPGYNVQIGVDSEYMHAKIQNDRLGSHLFAIKTV